MNGQNRQAKRQLMAGKATETEESGKNRQKKHISAGILIIMTFADLALIIAAVLCVNHIFTVTSVAKNGNTGTKQCVADVVTAQNEDVTGKTTVKNDAALEQMNIKSEEKNAQPDSWKSPELVSAAQELYGKQRELLVLVNKEQSLPEEYQQPMKLLKNKRIRVAQIMYQDLADMLNDAKKLGGYDYQMVSGYRDASYQQSLVERDVKAYMAEGKNRDEALRLTYQQVMPAGYSEHETGLALDITSTENDSLDETQADEACIQWLHENSWKYGFILRYPQDKEEITKISYEPWHFRYVGKEAAGFLYENQLTLEEFYQLLN